MFGRASGGARTPDWPHRHLTPYPGSPHWACVGTRREGDDIISSRLKIQTTQSTAGVRMKIRPFHSLYPFSNFLRFMYRETEEDNRIEETVELIFYILIKYWLKVFQFYTQYLQKKNWFHFLFDIFECTHKLSKKSASYTNLPRSTVILPYPLIRKNIFI